MFLILNLGYFSNTSLDPVEYPQPAEHHDSETVRNTLLLQQRVLPLQVVDVLLVRVVFSSHVLDVLCGFV